MKKLCIYHGNCADGFGAATVVYKALGDDVDFHAGVYQQDPPDVSDRDVILVDFSYKRDVLLTMADSASSILILDHHKSAQADLSDLPDNVTAHFDMEHCGAVLAWQHFFPDQQAPPLLQHIEDRDLWRFKLARTREILACLYSYPYDLDLWSGFLSMDAIGVGLMANQGEAIERKNFKDIREFIKAAAYRTIIAGHDVPVLNAPYMWSSDAGNIMGVGEPFAACYWDTPDGRAFSLRSADNGVDVSEIASLFGGGGHAHAAGFHLRHDELHRLASAG